MSGSVTGVGGGWAGLRTTKILPGLFPDLTGTLDHRAEFYTNGQNLDIANQTVFTDGIAVTTNIRNSTKVRRKGVAAS